MFTRCPACDTTFRLSAGDLRRAQGRVRCGECSSVFNALEYLAEEPEEAAAPDSWLPEPANDAIHPHDGETALLPAADIHSDDFDFDLDTDTDADDEKSDTAIFVTDPDDDGFSYATRTFGAGDAATADTTQAASEQTTDDRGDRPFTPSTTLAVEPATTDLAENIDEPDSSTPQDLYSASNAEPISASRWNEALQELEKAETGASLTVATRSNYLSPEELADIADETAELPIPALPAEPEEIETGVEEDFDDTIWERIPGVGSLGTTPGRPIEFDSGSSTPLQPDESANRPEMVTDADDLDPLEFNAPEETWSDIFISSSPELPDDDDEEFSRFLIEDEDEGVSDTDNSDADSELTNDAGDMARLEQIFNPERIAAMLQERAAGDGSAAQPMAAPAAHLVNTHAPGTVFDNPARQLGVKAWLTDDEKPEVPHDDEFPAEGYDVQHIILADESETTDVQNAANQRPAAVRKHEPPAWQTNEERPPARKGLWLTGSLLLVVALLSQLIHYNRDSLAASPAWGSTVMDAYSMLQEDIFPAWSLDDYEIRSAEAVAGESGADIMDIRAQIAVSGTKPTGLPYLRVVLSDRWSKPVAEKIFGPADYAEAGGLKPDRLLRPGESIEVHVSIVDPGAGAQGFELELCMPRRHTGMACTGQPFK